jgi:hypothetical protein
VAARRDAESKAADYGVPELPNESCSSGAARAARGRLDAVRLTYFLRLTSSHGDQVTERVTIVR